MARDCTPPLFHPKGKYIGAAIVHRNVARQTSSLCFRLLQRLRYFHPGHGAIRF
jgi:hypothetical protein